MPRRWTEDAFEIKESTIPGAGRGLFAKMRIEIEDTIGYYKGEVFHYKDFQNSQYAKSEYALWVCESCVIVGEGPKANYTRFINHSEDAPNAYVTTSTRWKSARIEAVKTIEPGEEIFFNYGDDFFND